MSDQLDNNLNIEAKQANSTIAPIVIRYALIATLLSAAFQMLLYMLDKHYSMLGIIGFIFPIIIVFLAINHFKKENGGFVMLGKGFLIGFLVFLLVGVLGWGFNYLYTEIIIPDYWDGLADKMELMFEKFGFSDDQMEKAIERTQRNKSNQLLQFGSALGFSAVFGAIVSIIAAAILKKEPKTHF